MQADWDKAIEFVLKMEGGYTWDPNDPGGETKYGISKKAYPQLDIANLSIEEAKAIYRTDFWNACSCDDLPSDLALCVFDMGVNQGTTKAKRILQMTLDVQVDGIIGPKTIAAAAKSNYYHAKKYLAHRLAEYSRLMVENPKLLIYANNWSYRVLSLLEILLIDGVK
jgi:lysozyme family protein